MPGKIKSEIQIHFWPMLILTTALCLAQCNYSLLIQIAAIWSNHFHFYSSHTSISCLPVSSPNPTPTSAYLLHLTMLAANYSLTTSILTRGIPTIVPTALPQLRKCFFYLSLWNPFTANIITDAFAIKIQWHIPNLLDLPCHRKAINKYFSSADSNSGLLRGVLTNAPPGSTQLVTYNYSTSNTTYIGAPLTAKNYASCGFARGVMAQGAYYVNCCADSLCLQGSAVYSNNLQNNNMNFVTKISAPVTAGLFAF